MTDTLLPAALLLLAGLQCFVATACFTLRDFSFSLVEELCRKRGRESRFGEILRDYERVLLACDWGLLFLVGLGFTVFALFGLPADLAAADGTTRVVAAGWLAGFVLWTAFFALLLPWSLGRTVGESVVVRTWSLLVALRLVLHPLVSASQRFDRIVHRLAGVPEPRLNGNDTLAEEIRTVVEEGRREGVLEHEATSMIRRVMELREDDAATIMTPRTDIFFLRADVPLDEARRMLVESGHSRVPVVGETQDDVIGILYAKDLLRNLDAANSAPPASLADIARDALYVPETTGIVNLLETMKRERVHVAIVVDEYGGVSGLVTMEDVLEEIVGDIVDEYDEAEEAPVRRISPTVAEVDARVHIDDLNEEFDYDLPEDGDFDTVGGFVFHELGRVPEPGETFTWRNLRLTVVEADRRKVVALRIELDESLVPAAGEA